jgi:hypothetical protein
MYGLVCESHAIVLPAQIGELDPHDRIVFGFQHETSNLQDSLPYINIWLTADQSVM